MKPVLFSVLFFGAALACHAQHSPYEIVIEAYIDGPSTLRFTRNGFYWQNGANAKPGRMGKSQPTYINGKPWTPKWRKDGSDRGEDTSNNYPWNIPSVELTCELISVTEQRGKTDIEKRTPIETKRENGEYCLRIPDPEPGARWYKIIVRAPDPLKPRK